jgi:hypothetical protein
VRGLLKKELKIEEAGLGSLFLGASEIYIYRYMER